MDCVMAAALVHCAFEILHIISVSYKLLYRKISFIAVVRRLTY
jgi:hypothetical protein